MTGLTDWSATNGRAKRVGVMHGLLNLGVTALYAASLAARRRDERAAGRTLAYLGYALSNASACLGGHLVFGEQIGVNHAAAQELPYEFVRVMPEAELNEGELRKVNAGGVPVLLWRRGDQIHAIYEICSHLGGPLAERRIGGRHSALPVARLTLLARRRQRCGWPGDAPAAVL